MVEWTAQLRLALILMAKGALWAEDSEDVMITVDGPEILAVYTIIGFYTTQVG